MAGARSGTHLEPISRWRMSSLLWLGDVRTETDARPDSKAGWNEGLSGLQNQPLRPPGKRRFRTPDLSGGNKETEGRKAGGPWTAASIAALSLGAERRPRSCIRKNADRWVKESQEPAWGLVLGTTDGDR